jgi:hypothetical protein
VLVWWKTRRKAVRLGYRFFPTLAIEAFKHFKKFRKTLPLLAPKTFNEKIVWSKIFVRDERMVTCADKYAVRSFVRDRLGSDSALVPLLLVTDDPADIRADRISASAFAIKVNHDSGSVIFCRDREKFDFERCRKTLSWLLKRNYSFLNREWQYDRIRSRKIIVEPLIEGPEKGDLKDYKFLCFNGSAKYVFVESDRFIEHKRDIFDMEWNRVPVRCHYPMSDIPPERPASLPQMIEIAERLSAGFDFVRVDLYDTADGVRFGEMTFHPASGYKGFTPPSFDRILGDLYDVKGTGIARWLPLGRNRRPSGGQPPASGSSGSGAGPRLHTLVRAD